MEVSAKFMGVGLKRLIGIALFTMAFIVMAKVVLAKHPIAGVSDAVHAV